MSDLDKEIKKYLKIAKKIERASEKVKSYDTGIIGERVIVATFKQLSIQHLEDIRYLLNNVIQEKKIYKRISEKERT